MKLSKENFNAGSPFSCWLREEMIGECFNGSMGFEDRGLVKKYKVRVDDNTEKIIMSVKKLDDYPEDLKHVAVEIIRMELDETFSI